MSLQNLTIKSQEILQQAQQLAFAANNVHIETEHILKALLNDKRFPSKLGRNGLSYVNKNFSKEICISQFESFLG